MTLKHGWQKLKLNDDKTALLPPFFLYLSLPPFPYLSRLLSVVTTSLSFILLGTLGSFLTQNYSRRNTSERSVKPLISSSNVLVQSADFSLKMRLKFLLQSSSNGLISATVSSLAYPILSYKISRKFKTLQQDSSSWHLVITSLHLSWKRPHWLSISESIKYKVACMCFQAINGSGPTYLSELLHIYTLSRTLRSSSNSRLVKIQQYKHKTSFAISLTMDPTVGSHARSRHCSTLPSFKLKLKTPFFTVLPFQLTSAPNTLISLSLSLWCVELCRYV